MNSFAVLMIAIFAFIGVTSGLTFKKHLQHKLADRASKLQAAIVYSTAHGQTYHTSVYRQFLGFVGDLQAVIGRLPADVKPEDTETETRHWRNLIYHIDASFTNVDRAETLKTSALYLAGMMNVTRFNGIKQIMDNVVETLRLETWASRQNYAPQSYKFPDPDDSEISPVTQLNGEYRKLRGTQKAWVVPTFEDHYALANRTRVAIEEYRKNGMISEADRIQASLAQFDEVTIKLARQWPIKEFPSRTQIETYYALSTEHYKLFVQLQNSEPFVKP